MLCREIPTIFATALTESELYTMSLNFDSSMSKIDAAPFLAKPILAQDEHSAERISLGLPHAQYDSLIDLPPL
jgi:hypothetical protein